MMFAVTLLSTLTAGLANQLLLNSLQANKKIWDMVLLQNATYLLNYAPKKLGTLFRANYFKKHYRLSYTHFGVFLCILR